jgi:uncharacterized protein involved in outer membrane biogenesis
MKKLIVRSILGLVILVVLALLGVGLFMDGIIKRGVETVGPMLTKVEVRLNAVNLSLLSGSGKLKGLFVGNPIGYKTPFAIKVGTATVAMQPTSLMSDKIVVKSINVQGPEITFETDLKSNNLSKILANLDEATGSSEKKPAQPAPAKPAKTLQVDDFTITGGKIYVSVSTLGGKTASVPLPEIHLTDLGKGPEGITPAELTRRVFQEIEKGAVKAAGTAVADLSKGAVYFTKELTAGGTNTAEKVKSIGDLFKRK